MRFLSLRALFLLGFVVAMPILALPPVARWVDELLYGPPPTDFGRPPGNPSPQDTPQPLVAERLSPTGFSEVGPTGMAQRTAGSEATWTEPPPLSPLPSFAPLSPSPVGTTAPEVSIDERAMARLQEVRQRLEELGAEYIVVESTDGTGQFCFRCRMLVEPQSRFTRSFEAAAADPVAAAQQVLREVEGWHSAAASTPTQLR